MVKPTLAKITPLALPLSLVLSFACRSAETPAPVLGSAHAPADARAEAERTKDPATAAELAWIEGNDRAYARRRLDEGLAAAPKSPALLLRRALLSGAELDGGARLDDELEIVRSAPDSPEAEAALLFISEWLTEHLDFRAKILSALDASGLLAERVPAAEPAAHGRAGKVALASAIASRLYAVDRNEGAMKKAAGLGGWLVGWRSLGPLAPRTLRELATPTAAELRGIDAAGAPEVNGVKIPVRKLDAWRLNVNPVAGDLPGLYVLESYFELPAKAENRPLELEIHLRDAGRVLVDGARVHEVTLGAGDVHGKARVLLRLAAGWHRVTIALLASTVSRPSLSLLAADGTPVITQQASTPGGPLVKLPPTVGRPILDLTHPSTATTLVDQLLASSAHAAFGRLLGAQLALGHWQDDLGRARRLATEGAELAPRSAVLAAAEARMMVRAGMPSSIPQARLRDALALDGTYPSVLASLARSFAQDTPDQALQLTERLDKAAPRSAEPYEIRFRIYQRRGWNAEAAKNLAEALARSSTEGLLLDGQAFYRNLMRFDEARALEAKLLELAEPTPGARKAGEELLAGNVDAAILGYRDAARAASSPAEYLTRIAELELGRGHLDEAIKAAEEAIAADPLSTSANRALAAAMAAKGDAPKTEAAIARLRALGGADLRAETLAAELARQELGLPEKGSWLEKELEVDPRALAKSATELDLRWSRHKIVHLLDRSVDRVAKDGRSLALRHSIVRLQTKEATDRAGEVNVPNDAIPLALRTLKANGRTIDVDRHSGKDDLSFSALAPGDAVEKQWVSVDAPATAWGGYLRRFSFQSSAPSLRSELVVIVPKGAKVWWKAYNGAPSPVVHEEKDETIYVFRATNVPALEPEPSSVSHEEFLPFVVVAVDVDEARALVANTVGVETLGNATWDVQRKALELTKGAKTDAEKVRVIFDFLSEQIGHGSGREPSIVLATKRGDRTGLFLAMLRAAGVDASIALGRPGSAPLVTPAYPSALRFTLPLVRIQLPGEVLWARMDRENPWIGKATPDLRGGSYLLPTLDAPPRPIPFAEAEVDRWTLASDVDLAVDEAGDAKGTLSIELPGTYGAELREFLKGAKRDDVLRALQGWIAGVVPGAKLERYDVTNLKAPLAPLVLKATIGVPSLMVRESGHLVSEQFFEGPLATRALGFPTLAAYLRLPKRSTPMWLNEVGERMSVRVALPAAAGAPVEGPRSFRQESPFGRFVQTFAWDGAKRAGTLTVEQDVPALRVSPAEFPKFRDLAQEILQLSRNRLIVPIEAAKRTTAMPSQPREVPVRGEAGRHGSSATPS